MRDPYQVLGVSRTASEAEIKRAYRKLAKENHPDRHNGDKAAQTKFTEINAAYEIVGDKDRRGQFDRGEIDAEGKPRFQGFSGQGFPGGGQAGGAGFENVDPSAFADAFSRFGFGGGSGGGRSRTFRFSRGGGGAGGSGPAIDEDILSAIFGSGGGGGGFAGAEARTAAPSRGADVRAEVAVTLEEIAEGRKPKVALPTGRTLALTLPKGVTDGQVIRLKGQGQASPDGGAAGDALVTVRLVPHPLFKAEGADLRLDLPVSLDEAVLGAKVAVPTLRGRIQITVPERSSGGRTLRLRGKGLPGASGPGDLLVTLRIVLPETPDGDLEALMRKWREEGRPSVRGAAFE